MNVRSIILAAAFLAAILPAHADLESSLRDFATYQPGQTRNVLHKARLLALKDSNREDVRARNEQLLLGFIQSDVSPAARREACLWLASLVSETSRPTLVRLTRDAELGEAAALVLLALEKPAPSEPGPPAHALAKFRAKALAAKEPSEVIMPALKGDDPALARLAFTLIDEKSGAWLAEHVLELPEDRQILALASVGEPHASKIVSSLAREGRGRARAAAVRRLRNAGNIQLLGSLLTNDDSAVAAAARDALVHMDAPLVRDTLRSAIGSKDEAMRKAGFEIIGERAEPMLGEELWRIARDESSSDRAAAIVALGQSAAPNEFEPLLAAFASQDGGSLHSDYQTAMWTAALRHPDYGQVLELIERYRKNAPEKTARSLEGMAKKLSKLHEVPALQKHGCSAHHGVLLPGPISEIMPRRFELAAYLDCGPKHRSSENGITIRRLNGSSFQREAGVHPALTWDFAPAVLEYEITGLDAGSDYILGMTWWDPGLQSRRQSLSINGEVVLPDACPVAYDEKAAAGSGSSGKPTPARIQFALSPDWIAKESIRLNIHKLAGPNAVNSELWIMKRSKPAAEKQILLISGQDFPGHHWRKTGPLMAGFIAADPRLEVTICESPYALSLTHLAHYDAVFIHFKNYDSDLPSTPAMRDGLEKFVRDGGGMCMSHFACGAFQEWPEFIGLAGRVWNGEGHDKRGPFTVRVVDRNHPVTAGLGDFETDDELYFCLKGDAGIHLLCDAHSKKKKADHPQAFVFQPGKGRAFLCTLGHDAKAYETREVQQLYRQGTAWAAGLN